MRGGRARGTHPPRPSCECRSCWRREGRHEVAARTREWSAAAGTGEGMDRAARPAIGQPRLRRQLLRHVWASSLRAELDLSELSPFCHRRSKGGSRARSEWLQVSTEQTQDQLQLFQSACPRAEYSGTGWCWRNSCGPPCGSRCHPLQPDTVCAVGASETRRNGFQGTVTFHKSILLHLKLLKCKPYIQHVNCCFQAWPLTVGSSQLLCCGRSLITGVLLVLCVWDLSH
ncbi:uncharacterized protein LOC126640190 isoform X2 [Myiozetetes cayanensis]|uniref:uncharacterized protein LOC126640190 isoform X2 n=1 Tax=Myiozetetes cayanensis TaxID=478635 RepID=UPI00215DF495|nr:uncharacterized protein LOC126640190 isoform X2 [Myiozetetes cayanensis]